MKRYKKVLETTIIFFLTIGLTWPIVVVFWHDIFPLDLSIPIAWASIAEPARVKTTNDTPTPAVQENIGLPTRISIPSIKMNAAIDLVGLLPNGAMGVPKIPRNVAWFKLGPRPGEIGSATISGHVNWWNGATAAFAKINKLKSGDKIKVQDDKGVTYTFIVSGSKSYSAAADATAVFFSTDGKAHLNLITCAGVWDKRTKQYTKRLVIFADKETE